MVENIARALNGHKAGAGWMACCPAHDDRTPSLSLRENRGIILVHCHTGCSQEAVIAALKELELWPRSEQKRLTPQERKDWERQMLAERQDFIHATYFARSARAMAELMLEEVSAKIREGADTAEDHVTCIVLTRLVHACRVSPMTEFWIWRSRHPKGTRAMVDAGRASEERAKHALTQFVNTLAAGDPNYRLLYPFSPDPPVRKPVEEKEA